MLTCGDHEVPPYDPKGEDGMYTFLCLENGIFVPTREWDLTKRVLSGKMSVNLQMKMWAESMWDNQVGCLLFPNELREYCQGMPEWVFRGTMEQAKKRILKGMGFIPTFMKVGDIP